MASMYVRLKPYNPRRGAVLKRYCYRSKVFYNARWYKVSESLAQELAELHQSHHDHETPYAFDVATEKQARTIEKNEKLKEEEERRKVDSAEIVDAQEVSDSSLRATTTQALPGKSDSTKSLGVSMSNSKAELIDIAESLGLDVPTNANKPKILKMIKKEVEDAA